MTKNIVRQKNSKRKYEIKAGEFELCTFGRTGKRVGKISGDTVYKDVSRESAFLKYPEPAIAWTKAALNYMREMGVIYIDVLDTDSGTHYKTTVQKYFDEGKYFDGGNVAKWGEQLKLTLPNFDQSRDPEYITTHSDPQAYAPADTSDVKPLHYVSHAPTGITYNGVKVDSVKQLDMFGKNKGGKHE